MARLGPPSFVVALLALGCGSDSRWRNVSSPPAPSPAAIGPGVRVFAGTTDCSSVPLAPDITAFAWIGRDTVMFIDSFDAATETGTLHYRSVKRGGTLDPAEPELIAEGVDTFAISAPALVYTVNDNTDADGVYVRAFGG